MCPRPARLRGLHFASLALCLTLTSSMTFGAVVKAPQGGSEKWTANELSILLPLPVKHELSVAIPLCAALTRKQLGRAVGQTNFETMPDVPIMMSGFNGKKVARSDFESMYLIAVRIDPCFKEVFADSCRKQVRFVWQPLIETASKIETLDGAVHTFHDLSDKDFASILKQMDTINSEFKDIFQAKPEMQIHPVLGKYGYQSTYYKRLSKLLGAILKQARLSRIAAMELHAFGEFWDFFAVDVDANGRMKKVVIPGFAATTVEFSNIFQRPAEAIAEFRSMNGGSTSIAPFIATREALQGRIAFRGVFGPGGGTEWKPDSEGYKRSAVFFASPIIRFLKDSDTFPGKDVLALKAKIQEIDNPSRHLPGTTDCVSCHATHPIRAFFKGEALQTESLRAFGYFNDTPSISQRTKNETAEVVRYLNQ